MRTKHWHRTITVFGILLMLIFSGVIVGCDDDDGESPATIPAQTQKPESTTEITIGALVDMTGPTAGAQVPQYYGYRDYYRYINEVNPIPGIELKVITYDTKYDPGRIPQGYVDLKSRGAQVMHIITGSNAEGLQARFEEDGIPFVGAKTTKKILDSPYYFSTASLPEIEQELIVTHIMDNWDYEGTGRSPKVGFIGMAGNPWAVDPRDKLQELCETNSEKIDWVGSEMTDRTQMTFANEVQSLEDCDYIVIQLAGPAGPAFIKEAKTRGYEGQIIGSYEVFIGFWMLFEDALPPEWLDGILMPIGFPSWDTDSPWVNTCWQYTQEYLSGSDLTMATKQFTNRQAGWMMGQIVAEAIRRAAEEVGPENVDSSIIRDEIAKTCIQDEAFGFPLMFSDDIHAIMNVMQVREYDAETDTLNPVSDWVVASFAEQMYENGGCE